MVNYTDFWQEPRPNLAILLRMLEGTLIAYTAPLQASITRDHGDQPELNVRWTGPDGISRVVQLVVNMPDADDASVYAVSITGAAWRDVDGSASMSEGLYPRQLTPSRQRHWFSESFGSQYRLATVQNEDSLPG